MLAPRELGGLNWAFLGILLICPNQVVTTTSTPKHGKPPASTHNLNSLRNEISQNPHNPVAFAGLNKQQNDYSCGPDRPCSNGACCGATGWCNYDPVTCGVGCVSNCNAKAECGQYADTPGKVCPLNVCCSEFGFCGTTADFCGSGCQSNCGTVLPPTPKVQTDFSDRVIGYYEGWSWNKRGCGQMLPEDIPAAALTHVNFAFAYVKPDTYDIIPMEGLPAELFGRVTNLKMDYPGLEVWISIGGWTFNDPDTIWQPVFSDLASTPAKRQQFVNKVIDFCVEYGFDGVDLDWEYPGAPDRGGHDEDRENYVLLLRDLRQAFNSHYRQLGITFTAPTSYWYLRWFNLGEIIKYVDWINVMSYDLHGVWDAENPIGPQVLAHTNLTEIGLALELFWRSGVTPDKIALGMGFYGRSFQLKDAKCTKPGCPFKGPADAGPCTGAAGILSYYEIQGVIADTGNAKPYYDEQAQVKYLVFGGDQWISFDDVETFQKKIEYAKNLGLSGMLIWAIDQDDEKKSALKALTGYSDLNSPIRVKKSVTSHTELFEPSQCITIKKCNAACPAGYTTMTYVSTYPGERRRCRRAYCCPAYGAPDPRTCRWRGKQPNCSAQGQCLAGEISMKLDDQGDFKKKCRSGYVAYCCDGSSVNWASICTRSECGQTCSQTSGFPNKMETAWEFDCPLKNGGRYVGAKVYDLCCPNGHPFSNCKWKGEGLNCDHAVCSTKQVQIFSHERGNRWPSCRDGRKRILCCNVEDWVGYSTTLPVSLDKLFPNLPSTGVDHAGNMLLPSYTTYTESSSNEAGAVLGRNDPNKNTFAWIVIVGDKRAVATLHKRDGSHMELFDCPKSRPGDYGLHIAKAVCVGVVENCEQMTESGVEGTIVRMPEHCTGDQYVRAVYLRKINSTNFEDMAMPHHLRTRVEAKYNDLTKANFYEFGFDYNFSLRKRNHGEIYIRIDYSTMRGYWDEIVKAAPQSSLKTRNFENFREHDKRFWSPFSSTWRQKFLYVEYPFSATKRYGNKFQKTLYSEKGEKCLGNGATFKAAAHVSLDADINVSTEVGFTLIGQLSNNGPTFDESYAFVQLDLDGKLGITLDAMARLDYERYKHEKLIPSVQLPLGPSINLKGFVEIGMYVGLATRMRGSIEISGRLRHEVNLHIQGLRYMFPPQLSDDDASLNVNKIEDGFDPQGNVRFTAGSEIDIAVNGEVGVTVIPMFGFRIALNKPGGSASKYQAGADIALRMESCTKLSVRTTNNGGCAGIETRVDTALAVTLSADTDIAGWAFASIDKKRTIYHGSPKTIKDWTCHPWSNFIDRRSIVSKPRGTGDGTLSSRALSKRAPLVPIGRYGVIYDDPNKQAIQCPSGNTPNIACYPLHLGRLDIPSGFLERRHLEPVQEPTICNAGNSTAHLLHLPAEAIKDTKRDLHEPSGNFTKRTLADLQSWMLLRGLAGVHDTSPFFSNRPKHFCSLESLPRNFPQGLPHDLRKIVWKPGKYYSWTDGNMIGTMVYDFEDHDDCNNLNLRRSPMTATWPVRGAVATPKDPKYATEHIFELQTLNNFFIQQSLTRPFNPTTKTGINCQLLHAWWTKTPPRNNYMDVEAIQALALYGFPNHNNVPWENNQAEFVILREEINKLKLTLFRTTRPVTPATFRSYDWEDQRDIIRGVIMAVKYLMVPEIRQIFMNTSQRIGLALEILDGTAANPTGSVLNKVWPPTNQTFGIPGTGTYFSAGLADEWKNYIAPTLQLAFAAGHEFLGDALSHVRSRYCSTNQNPPSDRCFTIGVYLNFFHQFPWMTAHL